MKNLLKNKYFLLLVVAVVGYIVYTKYYKKPTSNGSTLPTDPTPAPASEGLGTDEQLTEQTMNFYGRR
jgi:hypothetical protein